MQGQYLFCKVTATVSGINGAKLSSEMLWMKNRLSEVSQRGNTHIKYNYLKIYLRAALTQLELPS